MEVTGEDDEAQTVSTAYSKEINPAAYHANVNASNYYEQFNGSVLSETITRTVTGADGNTISTTDTYIRGKNKTETVTTYETDDFGRTTKESTTNKKYQDGKWLPSHETEVLYTYDNNGNVIQTETRSRKEGESGWQTKTTKAEYDSQGRLTGEYTPRGVKEKAAAKYTYDISGNHTKTVDKNGNTHKNTYDYQNRLTETAAKEKKTGKKTVHTYRYNEYGEVSAQDDTAFFYGDVSGQVTKETTKLSKHKNIVKNYSYDSVGNKSSFRITAGDETKLSLAYEYDGESKLSSVKDETGNEIAAYSYDTDGNLSERTVAGNGMTTTYAYDYQNQLTDLKNQTDRAGMISQYTSEYLVNGQKSEETSETVDKDGKKSQKTATYTYDLLGRITKETQTGREDISYTYDSNNNRKEMRAGNKITAYKYNKNDELIRTDTLNTNTEKDKVVIYKNDRNGNQLATVNRYEIPNDRKGRPYIDIDVTLGDNRLNENVVNHYNALNQLTKALTKNYKVSFTYDAEGLRTSKTVNGEKTVFVWDDDQIVMELSAGGKVKKRYIRGNDLIFADRGAENASGETSEKQYYVTDTHGNVVQLTDESGRVIRAYEYDSFGNETKPDRKDDNPFRYCGEYYDKETEEIYLRARYYQSAVGRFLTRDTYTGEEDEPESLHLYAYCENDGVNYVDSTGNKAAVAQPLPTPRPTIKPTSVSRPQPGPAPTSKSKSKSKATKIIIKYRKEIKAAGEKYSVDPVIVGGCIYAEQKRNVNFVDTLTDWVGFYGVVDTSIGIGQVKVSTAKMLEDKGYVSKSKATDGGWDIPLVGFVHGTRTMAIAKNLENDKSNIIYVAAYLKYWVDDWKFIYPKIGKKPEILGTLYNLGDSAKGANPKPKPNEFGKYVKKNYKFVKKKLK